MYKLASVALTAVIGITGMAYAAKAVAHPYYGAEPAPRVVLAPDGYPAAYGNTAPYGYPSPYRYAAPYGYAPAYYPGFYEPHRRWHHDCYRHGCERWHRDHRGWR